MNQHEEVIRMELTKDRESKWVGSQKQRLMVNETEGGQVDALMGFFGGWGDTDIGKQSLGVKVRLENQSV